MNVKVNQCEPPIIMGKTKYESDHNNMGQYTCIHTLKIRTKYNTHARARTHTHYNILLLNHLWICLLKVVSELIAWRFSRWNRISEGCAWNKRERERERESSCILTTRQPHRFTSGPWLVGWTCLTPSSHRRGTGGDRDPRRWGKRETIPNAIHCH